MGSRPSLAVWLYIRFTASLRDVEDMLAERGHLASYETVRCWVNKFGPAFVANIRRRRGKADCDQWSCIIQGSTENSGVSSPPSTRPITGEQPGRKLTSSCPTMRTQNATVQVSSSGPALRFKTLSNLQHLQYPASSCIPKHNARHASRRHGGMKCCALRCSMNWSVDGNPRARKVELTALRRRPLFILPEYMIALPLYGGTASEIKK